MPSCHSRCILVGADHVKLHDKGEGKEEHANVESFPLHNAYPEAAYLVAFIEHVLRVVN